MKKYYLIIAAALTMMFQTACNKSIEPAIADNDAIDSTITVIVSIASDDDPETRVGFEPGAENRGLKAYWETGDKIDLHREGAGNSLLTTKFTVEVRVSNGNAYFYASSSTIASAPYYAFYHNEEEQYVPGYPNLRYDILNPQTGKLDELSGSGDNRRWLMYSKLIYKDGDSRTMTCVFHHLNSVLKLTYFFPDLEPGTTVKDLGIKAMSGLYSTVVYDVLEGGAPDPDNYYSIKSYFLRTKNTYFTLDENRKVTIYLRAAPGTLTTITAEGYLDNVKYVNTGGGVLANSLTMQAGKVYSKTITMVQDPSIASSFSGGTGISAEDPYLIADAKELRYFAELINNSSTSSNYNKKYYKLIDDIDLGDGIIEWIPIGKTNNLFFGGHFDGDGHTISGTMKFAPGYDRYGLFGYIKAVNNDVTIKNVNMACTMDVSSMNTGSNCGAIVGTVEDDSSHGGNYIVTITNCSNSGSISSSTATRVGGIVGFTSGPYIVLEGCSNTGEISSSYDYVGNYVGGIV